MKPTQQEIIELAREAGFEFDKATKYEPPTLIDRAKHALPAFERLVHLALERFGAGGGQPVRYEFQSADGTWDPFIDSRHYENTVADGRWPIRALYAHPSPTDLRAEYLRGLEDAAKVCDEVSLQANAAWKLAYKPQDQGREMGADECADAIRALKGKQ